MELIYGANALSVPMGDIATLLSINLSSFDNTQVTTQDSLSDEMKTYYSDYLIDNAVPLLLHDQFAQKHPIPKGRGKIIEFRKYAPLAKALTPLTEGVTPSGNTLNMSVLTSQVKQYGDYIELSDVLLLTAIDNNLVQASKLLGNQAGETLDTVTREVINGGTNVQYGESAVIARHLLVGGESSGNHYLTSLAAKYAGRNLKNNKARKIDGDFVAIIHPDTSFDLTNDDNWKDWNKYTSPEKMYNDEIGKIHNIRFVETTEAKIFTAADLSAAARNLTYASNAGSVITISETLTSADQAALVGRKILLKDIKYSVTAAAANSITVAETVTGSPSASDPIYPGEAGAKGRAVYSTLIMGADAYGTTEVEGGGLEFIVKQLGSAGTSDPLNQRATSGWKAIKTAEILVDPFLVRLETTSTFDGEAN